MEYRRLGYSGLKVSEIGLGGNNFGGRSDTEQSIKVINDALEMGINFIDSAELYADGKSEEIIGQALKGKRSQVIIATKFAYPRSLTPAQQGGSRDYIMKAVEVSLKRLKTDYVDLYYIHWNDPSTPILETLRTMDNLVRSGKVRYIACSNYDAWQLDDAWWTSKAHNLEPFIAVQPKYHMLDRSIEKELVPCCEAHGISVIPWGPLASGFLTGKYHRGKKIPTGMRLEKPFSIYNDIVTDENYDKLDKLESFAKEHGHSVGELAIAWLLSYPWLGSVIAGVMNKEQISANIAAADWKLTAEDKVEIDKLI